MTDPARPATPTIATPPPHKPVQAGRRKRWLLALPAVLLLGALVWLFAAEGSQPPAPTDLADLADLPRVDGTLNVVEETRLVMTPFEPLDGDAEVEFTIPEKYRANFDLAHLRSHSSVGIPTRIYYLEQDGQLLAVYKADAPANGSG